MPTSLPGPFIVSQQNLVSQQNSPFAELFIALRKLLAWTVHRKLIIASSDNTE
jgi:hypothetical protein